MINRPTPWRVMLDTQWKWAKGLALLGVILGFSLPLFSLRTAAASRTVANFVAVMASWGVGYAIVAAALGLAGAMLSWTFDHRLRHVYALTLPIARWRFVLLRYAGGAAILLLPVLAVLAGAEIAGHSSLIPRELNAYPVALTLRFAFALFVAYSLFFAISSATARTAAYILGALAFIIIAQVALSAAGTQVSIVSRVVDVVFAAPGLLAVFGGRWTLIDV